MLFSWFDTRTVDAFVDGIVADLARRHPPAGLPAAGPAAGKAGDKLRKAHDQVLAQAAAFARRERPNLYQKARLANRVKWGLREAGFPVWFVDEFAYEVAAVVASANASRAL